jgi:hypothetical protein
MVEVRHVLNKYATQMPLVQDQQVIQTVISNGSHPPLRDGVGLGHLNGVRIDVMPRLRTRRWKAVP